MQQSNEKTKNPIKPQAANEYHLGNHLHALNRKIILPQASLFWKDLAYDMTSYSYKIPYVSLLCYDETMRIISCWYYLIKCPKSKCANQRKPAFFLNWKKTIRNCLIKWMKNKTFMDSTTCIRNRAIPCKEH